MRRGFTTTGRIKLGVLLVFLCIALGAFWQSSTLAKPGAWPEPTPTPATAPQEPNTAPAPPPGKLAAPAPPQTEGCVKCHNNIEPMHRYNASGDVFEKIDKD